MIVSDTMATSAKTLVFMDLEATGLNNDLPKITEICLVAVHLSSLENLITDEDGQLELPRVLDKLCLCVDPGKPITGKASEITGLSNTNLDKNEKQAFNPCLVHLINEFLNRQAQPVCLVAHNGFYYDFPLLKTELQKQEASLSSALLCMDTVQVFRFLDKRVGKVGENGYSLEAIYRRTFKKDPINSHNAEGDVLALIMVFLSKADQILDTMSTNCKRWGEICPMYG
uniref:exodeoxyribonuclease III n=1 Tax=Leptobrachium leishanense TaxID=445787 RepID=A0A8C5PN18_9ANUR